MLNYSCFELCTLDGELIPDGAPVPNKFRSRFTPRTYAIVGDKVIADGDPDLLKITEYGGEKYLIRDDHLYHYDGAFHPRAPDLVYLYKFQRSDKDVLFYRRRSFNESLESVIEESREINYELSEVLERMKDLVSTIKKI